MEEIDEAGTATVPGRRRTREIAPAALREQLTNLRALLVLSILMTETAEEDQILRLASSSAPSLGSWRIAGFAFADGTWRTGDDDGGGQRSPAGLREQLGELTDGGGAVELDGAAWAWAYRCATSPGCSGT